MALAVLKSVFIIFFFSWKSIYLSLVKNLFEQDTK